MYTTPQVQHVQHIHNSSTSHGETTLSLAGNLASRGNILRALWYSLGLEKEGKGKRESTRENLDQ